MTTAAPAPADPALLEAQRRAERLAAHGPTVRGVSVTATLAVISVLWTLLAAAPLLDGPWRFGPVLVAAVGAVIAVRAWVLARRRHTLQPFLMAQDERPFAALQAQQRRAVWRQVIGRAPVTAESAPLVRAFTAWQRRSSEAAVPSVLGMGFGLVGLAWALGLSEGEWWLLVSAVVAAAFVWVATRIETHRRERALRSLGQLTVRPISAR